MSDNDWETFMSTRPTCVVEEPTSPGPTLWQVVMTGQEMADLYVAGHSGEDVAARAGCTPGRVTQLVKQATGMTPREYRVHCGWANRDIDQLTTLRVARAIRGNPRMLKKDLAALLEVSEQTVVFVARARGLTLYTDRRVFTGLDEIADMVQSYIRGESTFEIADRYGVDERTIRRRIDESGMRRRGPGPRINDKDATVLVVAAWQERPSLSSVERKVHLTKPRIKRLLVAAGLLDVG